MEIQKETTEKPKLKKEDPKKTMILKKIDPDAAKTLSQIRDRANKKTIGRKVKDGEIIAAALKLITQDHIRELQELTYSQKDKLLLAHEDFQRLNGKLSLDLFIDKLLRGEAVSKP